MTDQKRGGFNLDDYVTVAERIEAFYAKYPEGSLQSRIIELSPDRVVIEAQAYRTATDERPGIGLSSLDIPGTTTFTRGSEVENAETSAWGRAIAALGFNVKKGVASRDEISNKQGAEPKPRGIERTFNGTAVKWQKPGLDAEVRLDPEGNEHYGFVLECEDGKKRHVNVEGDLAKTTAEADPIDKEVSVTGLYRIEDLPNPKGGTYKAGVIYASAVTVPGAEAPTAPMFDAEETERELAKV